MKVLIVFNQPAPYKIDFFNLLGKEVDLSVIFERKYETDRDPLFYKEKNIDFNIRYLSKGKLGKSNSISNELTKILKKEAHIYDFIIMNGYSTFTEMLAIRYLNKKHIPWYLHINGGLIKDKNLVKKILKRKIISSASGYFCPIGESDKYLLHYGARKDKIAYYPNTTYFEKDLLKRVPTKEDKKKLRKKLNLPENEKILICPSSFIKRKNNLSLIKLFDGRSHLLLIGSGTEKTKYEKEIKNGNFNVTIIPYKDKESLKEYYQAADCLITLSKEDIYGHTIHEGMANGLPIISSNKVVSALHLVENGKNGYIIPNGDIRIAKKAVDSITETMGEESLKRSKEYTFEKYKDCYLKGLNSFKK